MSTITAVPSRAAAGSASNSIPTVATVLGPDARITGQVSLSASAVVLGTIEGTLTSTDTLRIGEGATCRASVDARVLIVDGTVEGDILAREKVVLNSTARVVGDIHAGSVAIAEGAKFEGQLRVGPASGTGTIAAPETSACANSGPSKSVPGPVELATALASLEAKFASFKPVAVAA